jgi:hypothetical protein
MESTFSALFCPKIAPTAFESYVFSMRWVVARDGLEPPTPAFSGLRSAASVAVAWPQKIILLHVTNRLCKTKHFCPNRLDVLQQTQQVSMLSIPYSDPNPT